MTNQEAIDILLDSYPPKEKEKLREAIDLATNALRVESEILNLTERHGANRGQRLTRTCH